MARDQAAITAVERRSGRFIRAPKVLDAEQASNDELLGNTKPNRQMTFTRIGLRSTMIIMVIATWDSHRSE